MATTHFSGPVESANGFVGAVTATTGAFSGPVTFASSATVRGVSARKFTVAAETVTATLTAAEIVGGMITANQGAAGPATYTLPTGTNLQTLLGTSFITGDSIDFTVTNVSTVAAEDVTIQGNTGTTLFGSGFVASNAATTDKSAGTFRFVCSGVNTFNVYRIG
jgi:hypothetical protein